MDFNGQYPAGYIAGPQFDLPPEPVFAGETVEGTKLVLPCKTIYVTVCIGDDRDKDKASQLVFKCGIDSVRLK